MTDRLLSYRSLKQEFTLSESSVRRLIARDQFPRPKYIGQRAVFAEGEVREALAKLITDRPSGPEASR